MKTNFLFFLSSIVMMFPMKGQIDDFDAENFSLRFYGGPTASIVTGSGLQDTKEQLKTFEAGTYGPNVTPKGAYTHYVGFNLGANIDYQLSEKLMLGIGVKFSRRGFGIFTQTLYEDFEFQYDELDREEAYLSMNTIDIPVIARYQFLGPISVYGGLVYTQRSNLVITENSIETVTINGKKDDGYSSEDKVENDFDQTAKNSWGIIIGLHTQLSDQLGIRLDLQRTGEITTNDNKVYMAVLNLGIEYSLNEIFD